MARAPDGGVSADHTTYSQFWSPKNSTPMCTSLSSYTALRLPSSVATTSNLRELRDSSGDSMNVQKSSSDFTLNATPSSSQYPLSCVILPEPEPSRSSVGSAIVIDSVHTMYTMLYPGVIKGCPVAARGSDSRGPHTSRAARPGGHPSRPLADTGNAGFEPTTSGSGGQRSIQLS